MLTSLVHRTKQNVFNFGSIIYKRKLRLCVIICLCV